MVRDECRAAMQAFQRARNQLFGTCRSYRNMCDTRRRASTGPRPSCSTPPSQLRFPGSRALEMPLRGRPHLFGRQRHARIPRAAGDLDVRWPIRRARLFRRQRVLRWCRSPPRSGRGVGVVAAMPTRRRCGLLVLRPSASACYADARSSRAVNLVWTSSGGGTPTLRHGSMPMHDGDLDLLMAQSSTVGSALRKGPSKMSRRRRMQRPRDSGAVPSDYDNRRDIDLLSFRCGRRLFGTCATAPSDVAPEGGLGSKGSAGMAALGYVTRTATRHFTARAAVPGLSRSSTGAVGSRRSADGATREPRRSSRVRQRRPSSLVALTPRVLRSAHVGSADST